jgi:hypothetical protein
MQVVVYYPLFGGRRNRQLAQRTAVAGFLEASRSAVHSEFVEKKPGLDVLRKAIAKCRQIGAPLVIGKLGFLIRSLSILRLLRDSNVPFFVLDDQQLTPATLHVYLVQAEEAWTERSLKIKDGIKDARKAGQKFGSAQRGHWNKKNKHLRDWKKANEASVKLRAQRVAEAYAPILPIMESMRKRGESYDAIAIALNEAGHLTTAGTPFTAPTVFKALKRHGGKNAARRKGVGRAADLAAAQR